MTRANVADERAIFIVGFMGCGKSTLGRQLAGLTGRPFHDTDAMVEQAEGRTIARIFTESGEAGFRRAERRALRGLAGAGGAVVACGGGLYLDPGARRWIRERGRTVWLDAPLELCRRRLESSPGRPLWACGAPLAQRELYERRRVAYALADLRFPGLDEAPGVAARRLAGCLGAIFR